MVSLSHSQAVGGVDRSGGSLSPPRSTQDMILNDSGKSEVWSLAPVPRHMQEETSTGWRCENGSSLVPSTLSTLFTTAKHEIKIDLL